MHLITNWYTKSSNLRMELRRILDLVRENDIDLISVYINTLKNCLADDLSRLVEEKVLMLEGKPLGHLRKVLNVEKLVM